MTTVRNHFILFLIREDEEHHISHGLLTGALFFGLDALGTSKAALPIHNLLRYWMHAILKLRTVYYGNYHFES